MAGVSQRCFGAAAHGHDEHHDDHHGHHVETADPNHKFLDASNANKKYIVFNGMRATEPVSIEIENPYRHHNDLPLLQ